MPIFVHFPILDTSSLARKAFGGVYHFQKPVWRNKAGSWHDNEAISIEQIPLLLILSSQRMIHEALLKIQKVLNQKEGEEEE